MKKHLQLLVIIIIVALLNAERANAQVESSYSIGNTSFLNLPSIGMADIDSTDVRNGETSKQINFGVNTIVNPPTNVRVDNVNVCNGASVTLTATCESNDFVWWSWQDPSNPYNIIGAGSPFKHYPIDNTTQTYFARCIRSSLNWTSSEAVATEAVTVSSYKILLTENFNESPNGWLVRDVDNKPTDTWGVGTSTWNLNAIYKGTAVTTSKTGFTSDDWLWTPLISNITKNTKMTWYRRGFIDYEVRVMKAADGPPTGGTEVIGNQLTHSTQVSLTTTHYGFDEVSLAAFAGQSIYIAFRNRGQNDDIFRLDDIIIDANRTTPLLPPTGTMANVNKICGYGSVTLTANCSDGILTWYNQAFGGVAIGTGSPFLHAPNQTTTYYASCISECESSRVATDEVTVYSIPTAPIITPPISSLEVCFPSTLTFTASGCEGTVTWSQGAVTGTTLTLTEAGGYSVSATCTNSCFTSNESEYYSAYINLVPNAPTNVIVNNTNICNGSTVSLTANCEFGFQGQINWYTQASGGVSIGSGNPFTHIPSSNVTYYAACADFYCESARVATLAVTVTNSQADMPTSVAVNTNNVCSNGTVSLTANCLFGTVNWYNQAIGGIVLGTGSPFLHALTSETTYYASCINGCESDRVATNRVIPAYIPLFTESFDGIDRNGFPNGWFLRNVDNLAPIGLLSDYNINDAWVRTAYGSDSVVISTSFYDPAGQADDWMWTPLIQGITANTKLKWKAIANNEYFYDGYEVRIMTGTNGPPTGGTGEMGNQLTNSTRVLSIYQESPYWTSREVSLTDYAGQSVYVGFRNNSNDKHTLLINDVIVEAPIVPPTGISTNVNEVCQNGTVTLTANCPVGTINWYKQEIGGVVLGIGTGSPFIHSPTFTTTYYASCVGGCESSRVATNQVTVIFVSPPNITPPRNQRIPGCVPITLVASNCAGTVTWSEGAATGTSLTLSMVGTYPYITATCTINGCSASKTLNNLQILKKPNTPIITPLPNIPVCSPSPLKLIASECLGLVTWSQGTTGTILTLSDVGTYNISASCSTIGYGCFSDTSTVEVEIKARPNSPTITPPASLSVCSPKTLTLTASGCAGTVIWSQVTSMGTILTPTTVGTYSISATGTYNITATCTVNGCTSEPSAAVTGLEIKATNSPTITPPASLSVCSSATLTLTASGCAGTVTWSQGAATGTSLTLSDVGTYSITATCTVNGCTSAPSAAVTGLEIKAIPNAPTIIPPASLSVCSPATLTLTASGCAGTVTWSQGAATGTNLTLSSAGTYSITATCTVNGCTSTPSTAVAGLEIKAKPNAPTISPPANLSVCSPATLTLTASGCAGTITWSQGAATGTSLTLSDVGTYSITATCTFNGCTSAPSAAVAGLEIKARPSITASNSGPYTFGQTINLIGSGSGTYSWAGPNHFYSTLSNPIITNAFSINAGVYTLAVVGTNGCQATATTNVVIESIDPCNISRIVDYLYVKAGSPYESLFQLTNGMIINQITEKVSILVNPVCSSIPIESFEMSIQGPELNWSILHNAAPYGLFDNFGLEGKYFNPGSYTLTVTGYAQDNKGGGITYGPKIITFVVVGYLATINTPSPSKTTICAGNSIDITFAATGIFNNTNQFHAELSDASGSFESPILIGTTNSIGTINGIIPPNTVEGANYRIRVISSNQVVVSNPAVSPITVYPLTHSLISPNNNLTGINIKKAVNTINARNKITSPANITYQAGKAIVLTSGFESNAVFKAEIKACDN